MGYLNSSDKTECFGCRACEEICPQKAITVKTDEEGFFYPIIDTEKCIGCKLCEKTCPKDYSDWIPKEKVQAYYGCADDKTIFDSSSGGAFTAIYHAAIKNGYHVYGVKFDDNFRVIHACADSLDACKEFRKSKYVQSNTNHTFSTIEEQLKNGDKVLFSGTPCQNAALQSYLSTKRVSMNNLLTVAVLCHGVPNQYLFDLYLEELKKKGGEIKDYTFKYKKNEDGKYNPRTSKISFVNGEEMIVDVSEDPYLKGYYTRLFYRPSCGKCIFARQERVSDITIADAWKIEQIIPELNPQKGVSLVLLHSEKANLFKKHIDDNINLIDIDAQWALNSQALMQRPTDMNKNRAMFFSLLENKGFSYAVKKSTWNPNIRIWLGRQKRKLKKLFK